MTCLQRLYDRLFIEEGTGLVYLDRYENMASPRARINFHAHTHPGNTMWAGESDRRFYNAFKIRGLIIGWNRGLFWYSGVPWEYPFPPFRRKF